MRESSENDADNQETSWAELPPRGNLNTAVGKGGTMDETGDDIRESDQMSFPSSRGHGNPARAENSDWSTRLRHSRPNIVHDLSFILHPSHEVSKPEKDQTPPSAHNVVDSEQPVTVARACSVLGVSQTLMDDM